MGCVEGWSRAVSVSSLQGQREGQWLTTQLCQTPQPPLSSMPSPHPQRPNRPPRPPILGPLEPHHLPLRPRHRVPPSRQLDLPPFRPPLPQTRRLPTRPPHPLPPRRPLPRSSSSLPPVARNQLERSSDPHEEREHRKLERTRLGRRVGIDGRPTYLQLARQLALHGLLVRRREAEPRSPLVLGTERHVRRSGQGAREGQSRLERREEQGVWGSTNGGECYRRPLRRRGGRRQSEESFARSSFPTYVLPRSVPDASQG